MKRVLRIFRRTLTALLALVAVLSIVMWPLTNKRPLVLLGTCDQSSIGKFRVMVMALHDQRMVLARMQFTGKLDRYPLDSKLSWEWTWHTFGGWKWEFGTGAATSSGFDEDVFRKPVQMDSTGNVQFSRTGATSTISALGISLWLVSLIAAAWPATSFFLWNRRRRIERRREMQGHCPACGYDLRATPEQGGELFDRCPECGVARA